MFVNARVIIETEIDGANAILIQTRNKPYEGGKWLELPGGRVNEFESLIDALKREVKEETGLQITCINGISTRLETGSPNANVECLVPFAVYQTLEGPVDSMGMHIFSARQQVNCLWLAMKRKIFNGSLTCKLRN